jgi:hypothetical protein
MAEKNVDFAKFSTYSKRTAIGRQSYRGAHHGRVAALFADYPTRPRK